MNQISRAETESLGVFDDKELQQLERLTMLAYMAGGQLPDAVIQEIMHQAVTQEREFAPQIYLMAKGLADAMIRLNAN